MTLKTCSSTASVAAAASGGHSSPAQTSTSSPNPSALPRIHITDDPSGAAGDSSSSISEAFKSQRHHSASSHRNNAHSSVVEEKVLLGKLRSATKALTGRPFSFSMDHLDRIIAGEDDLAQQIISSPNHLAQHHVPSSAPPTPALTRGGRTASASTASRGGDHQSTNHNNTTTPPQRAKSENDIHEMIYCRLEESQRSLSTRVALGDASIVSHICTPNQTGGDDSNKPMRAEELVRSISKQPRYKFIRKVIHKTLLRAEKQAKYGFSGSSCPKEAAEKISSCLKSNDDSAAVKKRSKDDLQLSMTEIEKDRGRPLSNYQKNLIVFDWLHAMGCKK